MCPIDFVVKGKGHNALITSTEYGLYCIIDFPLTYHHETSHIDSRWVEDVPNWFRDQKVKGQGYCIDSWK